MGLLNNIRALTSLPDLVAARGGVPVPTLASPWAERPNHLESVVWADIFGLDHRPVSRAEAMTIPAFARSRRLLAATVARLPMVAENESGALATQPIWIGRTDGGQSPFHRLLWTIDDLLFYGWSLWLLTRDSEGTVIRAARVAFERWDFDSDGFVTIDSQRVADGRDICLIPGVDEGVLAFGGPTIRHAANLLRNADKATSFPTAFLNLKQTNDADMTEPEIDALIARWHAARKGQNGGVSYTNPGIEIEELGAPTEQLLLEGRNASAVDIARLCGIPASLIDASAAQGNSTTYSNQVGRNQEFIDYGLSSYIAPVAARLGMDDIVPRGTRIAFDLTDFTSVSMKPSSRVQDDVPPDDAPPAPAVIRSAPTEEINA